MKITPILLAFGLAAGFTACQSPSSESETSEASDSTVTSEKMTGGTYETMLHYPQETHLANVRQLTFGGDNAEGYFSFDDSKLVFQSNHDKWGLECDQIFYMDIAKGTKADVVPPMLSTGKGRTTCSYFMPGDTTIIYSSTHLGGDACPAEPERGASGAYVWPIYDSFDIFVADLEGNILDTLIGGPGYDAEPTVSPNGDRIVFTSNRSGDLELYTCNIDGSDIVQITDELGYDGGAFFSPDGSKIVFRSSRPKTDEEIAKYTGLLEKGMVEPTNMEIYVCNANGSGLTQVTDLGNANWAPFFHPGGEKIIFSSNHASERGFPFNLFMINLDGSGLEQITFDSQFDAFAMFSYGGEKLVFASNRINSGTRATNLFIADWVE
ncbi:MAG: PD40 domain-containing protein [Flavobacteriales bacterium]|nr:PD40 domain-containing protein [Flavobacteriales bacterium]